MRILLQQEIKDLLPANGISQLKKNIDIFASNNTLIVFDLDFTLIQPVSKHLKIINLSDHIDIFRAEVFRLCTKKRYLLLNYLTYSQEIELVNNELPVLIERAKHKGSKILGLSSMAFGSLLGENLVHKKRISQIGDLGISFSQIRPNCDFFAGSLPCTYFNGVIFTNTVEGEGKASALVNFLGSSHEYEKIVYVDDNPDNLSEMERYFQKSKIKDLMLINNLFLDAYSVQRKLRVSSSTFQTYLEEQIKIFQSKL